MRKNEIFIRVRVLIAVNMYQELFVVLCFGTGLLRHCMYDGFEYFIEAPLIRDSYR